MSIKTLPEFKASFDPKLQVYLDSELTAYKGLIDDAIIHALLDRTGQIITHGGKRLRPYLTWLMYQAASGTKPDSITSYLIALELFHGFCLIHDDIMDHGSKRH